jgi:Flp pilus assembly protein TadD
MHRFFRPFKAALIAISCMLPFFVTGAVVTAPRTNAENHRESEPAKASEPHFVGSQKCATCHQAEHSDWMASQHHAAMQEANETTVLGDFENAKFVKDGRETTFFKRDNKFWVRTDGHDGKPGDFEIRYTFGVSPLQQYLIPLPQGRFQALGVAWDTRPKEMGGQRWYDLYPDRKLKPGDPLHWTGIDQNWNYQCAWCHSTNLQKNYDRPTGAFKTTWSEINVGCEACHGPASKHVEWAKSNGALADDHASFAFGLDERKGVSWPMGTSGQAQRSSPLKTNKEIQVCAQCHSRREQFSSIPQDIGRLFDAFRPATLEAGLYYPDGQQHDEVYTYASFLQSRMHAAGVTCSDCHNPHSGKVRLEGNALCGQCHAPERFDVPAHHHHTINSSGAKCTSCHMPTTTYMGIDPRHDHSLRIPRPDRTVSLGTPNACNQCHADKTPAWARDAIKQWYPSPNPGAQSFAEALSLGDQEAPGAQEALRKVVTSESFSSIAKASALARLAQFPSPGSIEVAAQSLKSDNPMVRTAAISVVARADDATKLKLLTPLLNDPTRLVRMDAARALAGPPATALDTGNRELFDKAINEYVDAQLFNAERPEALTNLGGLYRLEGKIDDARQAFEQASAIDPKFVAAAISLADVIRTAGDEKGAEIVLQRALAENPDSGPVEHALGLSLVRQRRMADAVSYLSKAATHSPEDPQFAYVLAVALHDTGKRDDAVDTLKTALLRHPYDRNLLWALASYEFELGNREESVKSLRLLRQLEPDRTDITQLLNSLTNGAPQ